MWQRWLGMGNLDCSLHRQTAMCWIYQRETEAVIRLCSLEIYQTSLIKKVIFLHRTRKLAGLLLSWSLCFKLWCVNVLVLGMHIMEIFQSIPVTNNNLIAFCKQKKHYCFFVLYFQKFQLYSLCAPGLWVEMNDLISRCHPNWHHYETKTKSSSEYLNVL